MSLDLILGLLGMSLDLVLGFAVPKQPNAVVGVSAFVVCKRKKIKCIIKCDWLR